MLNFHVEISTLIEIVGTLAFAMSGAFAAMQHRLDPLGIIIISFITAVGGGTVRDLLLGQTAFWMTDMAICLVIFLSCLVAMVFKSLEHNFRVTLFVFDSLGLGLFTIVGVTKGMEAGFNPVICVTLGAITGCFGGLLRDVLLNRIPLLLREEIYATASIVGAFLYIIIGNLFDVHNAVLQVFTVLVVFLIRHISVKYHLQLPRFYLSSEQKMKRQMVKMRNRKYKNRKK